MNHALLQQAIDTIGYYDSVCGEDDQETPAKQTIQALRSELAKPEPQPIAYLRFWAHQSVSPDGGVEADEGLEVCGRTEIGDDGRLAKPVYTKEQL